MPKMEAKDAVLLYREAQQIRSRHEPDWRMAAAYCLPRHFSSWQTAGPAEMSTDQTAARRFAFDSTGVNAVPKYAAILNRIATPESQRWHRLRADKTELMRIHHVRQYFDALNDELFKMRYATRARFSATTGEVYTSIGVYGMGPMSVGWRAPMPADRRGGFAYKAWPLRDIYILTDENGQVVAIFRRIFWNARQYRMKFGSENAPRSVAAELAKPVPSETRFFEFFQFLSYRDAIDYDPDALDYRRHPVRSCYVAVEDQEYVGDEEGYLTMPLLTPRTNSEPGDLYGYSPAIQALPALGGVSAMKKTVLKAGHKAVDPTVLAHDDGILQRKISLLPGKIVYGGVNSSGQRLVQALEVGNFQVAENLIADERNDIKESFFVTLFTILTERPEATATQIMEEVAEKAALVAPTMGRLQAEMLGPKIEREVALLAEHGRLPEMPMELQEAAGEYTIQYTSPMAKGQYAEEVAGFMRWAEGLMNAAQVQAAAGDQNLATDWVNWDEAAPEVAEYMSVRTGWVRDTKAVSAIRESRAQAVRESELIKQAPAGAAVAKEMLKTQGGVPGVSNG